MASFNMISLNAQQKRALEFVSGGHNLVLLGPAGTGKSFLVNRVVEICSTMGKQCAVTATTGIACSVYPAQLKPMTIHRWSGIGDGRYDSSEMKRIVKNNVRYKGVMDRIFNTDVLIIDECSMFSKRLLETLHEVCSLKNPQLYFGGIQVILVGDFVQLPPVPCARYNEDGSYCFESDIYRAAFPHHIILKDVIRQKDKLMVEAIREISLGEVSNDTISLIKQLTRPLNGESIKLFATNDLVDDYNRDQILDFPGHLVEFKSSDTGDKKYLNDMLAAKKLWLKIGIPVVLIKNLSDVLVNGLMGEVYDICDDGKILVEFPKMNEKIYVDRVKFEVFDPRKNKVVATREQLPLKPAYALTIHKSQGMTLERVEVDCRDIFKPGQLGVAIGRARSLDGLRVINFNKNACIKQPEKIQRFLTLEDSIETKDDRSCCNNYARLDMSSLNI
ncbi:uncharacterized protein LOC128551890 [Mercenaria mercenaria]|uniref:uncharacterized protein LOC128551890 n=1 Tax=Mercenaria mercenaria TaxID=6596 RepID=UPI00234E68F6|nr:uncharacterized protein LOC128551890 [Mercenaria mercenaria]